MQGAYLSSLPLESDGSASPERLARRAVVRRSLPATVTYHARDGMAVLELALDGRGQVSEGPATRAARSFMAEVAEKGTITRTDPGGDRVWVALDPGGKLPYALHGALEHPFALRVQDEQHARHTLLEASFHSIGWHALELKAPDGAPDERIAVVARWVDGPKALGTQDLLQDMLATHTLSVVPAGAEAVLQTARLLYLRGWNQWEFFTLARREAAMALEVAVRALVSEERGQAARGSFSRLIDIAAGLTDPSVLSAWECSRAHAIRESRNEMVHPSREQTIDWISWARQGIDESVALTNLMWGRRVGGVPRSFGWEVADHAVEVASEGTFGGQRAAGGRRR